MNSLYGENIRKGFEESCACKSEYWMMSEKDERGKDCWRKHNGNYIV